MSDEMRALATKIRKAQREADIIASNKRRRELDALSDSDLADELRHLGLFIRDVSSIDRTALLAATADRLDNRGEPA